MSLQAYQQAATRAENPRDMEYRLFAQVTLALMDAAKLDRTEVSKRVDALDWNRRLWSALGSDCGDPGNKLPPQLRPSIISLSGIMTASASESRTRSGWNRDASDSIFSARSIVRCW